MRAEAIAWLLGGLLALAGGAAAVRRGGPGLERTAKTRAAFYLSAAALLCIPAGLVWRAARTGIWTNGAPSEGLALLAGGALACLICWQGRRRRGGLAAPLAAAGLILLAAASLGWSAPAASPSPQARTWLFGVRSLLAGLGLGGWPIIGVGVIEAAGRGGLAWRRGLSRRVTAPAAPGVTAEVGSDGAAAGAERAGAEAAVPEAVAGAQALAAAAPRVEAVPVQPAAPKEAAAAAARALAALRFSYPWLTAAVVAAGAWNAVAYATPWRSRPGDLWLAVTWLAGAACLHLASRREDTPGLPGSARPHVYLALLGALALCGLAAALLAVLQAPTLLS